MDRAFSPCMRTPPKSAGSLHKRTHHFRKQVKLLPGKELVEARRVLSGHHLAKHVCDDGPTWANMPDGWGNGR